MIKSEKPLDKPEQLEEVTKKPLSDEELSSLIKASNVSKFNEVELKVKKRESESFRKVALHDIAKQINSLNENKNIKENKEHNKDEQEINENKKNDHDENKYNEQDQNQNEDLKENENIDQDEENEINLNINNQEKQKKSIEEDEHFKVLEEEKKIAYEKGKSDAFNEIKEGSDAAIAQLKKVIENISKVEELDLQNFEKVIQEKVTEITFDLTGKIIKDLPSEFIKKIKSLLAQLENIDGNIDIFINEEDHKVIESNKSIKNEMKKLCLYSSKELQHGEIELKVNGIS
ncbi:MAG: hypothetical protein CBC22_06990, partial [Alphaproteobacteria bacterium TMED62]